MLIRILSVIVFLVCFQDSYCQVTIIIYNRSNSDIDSVVVDGTKLTNFGRIKQASKNSFFVGADQANFHSFAPFYLKVFVNGHVFSKQWMKTGFVDSLFFYDHGINTVDKPLTRPTTFQLSVFNSTSRNLDTVVDLHNAIRDIIELSPRRRAVVFDHEKADSNEVVFFKLGDTVLKAHLNFHDFDNWTDTLNSVYLENDSVLLGLPSSTAPIEYIVDLYLQGVPMESVQVQSSGIIKIYNWPSNFAFPIKRIVFDYKSLKLDPKIKIKVGNKTHVITLSESDLKSEDKFYFVTKRKVR